MTGKDDHLRVAKLFVADIAKISDPDQFTSDTPALAQASMAHALIALVEELRKVTTVDNGAIRTLSMRSEIW
jgi:hypothetical protein